jgi:hypothetical protein
MVIDIIMQQNGKQTPITYVWDGCEAVKLVRLSFNPSSLKAVDELKLLAAAFISRVHECKADLNGSADPSAQEAGRNFALAITNMQQASMWAVAGATAHLNK